MQPYTTCAEKKKKRNEECRNTLKTWYAYFAKTAYK